MAADVTITSTQKKPHTIPSHRNHDHSTDKHCTALEILHQCLGHRKCHALLATSEHGVWADTVVQMGSELECVSCEISTVCTANRNKETHTGGTYAGEYIFMDILHPVMNTGLRKSTTFAFYLILVDAFSRYACIYGILDKSSLAVIDTLTQYQADHGHIGNYGYLDTARLRADSGSHFTSKTFKKHCWEAGIQLSLAAPKMQYHLAERTWQQ
jgi:transposase InsO family protein